MALPPGGADLQGGRDEPRNADVAALKRLFYRTANEAAVPEEASAALRLGLHIDLPTCRWGTEPFLPHQQLLLNIFQPEYTHLFEALVATPRPWLYMHLHPGGRDNLDNPEFALPSVSASDPGASAAAPPSAAPLDGTLMQVVSYRRLPDARLRLVVQGLGRATVLRGTQSTPYARADVQLLPDSEALMEAARRGRQWMLQSGVAEAFVAETGAAQLAEMSEIEEIGALRRRMVLAAAVAEETCWRAYEHRPYELRADDDMPPAFSSYDVKEAGAAVTGVDSAVQGALREVMVPPDGAGSLSVSEAVARRCEASERVSSALAEAVVMSPLDESEEVSAHVHTHTCIRTLTHTRAWARAHTCTSTRTHTCTSTRTRTCTSTRARTSTSTHTRTATHNPTPHHARAGEIS